MEKLDKYCKRDNAVLIGEYSEIKIGTVINYKCKCEKVTSKTIQILRVTGFFCDSCIQKRKGFYLKEPDNINKCSVCGIKPMFDSAIIDDNWETCLGRNMFFCPFHRVQYPCNNHDCDADLCNNFHGDSDWMNKIKYWNYDNERYN